MNWSRDPSDIGQGFHCIYDAISTIISFDGSVKKLYITVSEMKKNLEWIINNGKRSLPDYEAILAAQQAVADVMAMPVQAVMIDAYTPLTFEDGAGFVVNVMTPLNTTLAIGLYLNASSASPLKVISGRLPSASTLKRGYDQVAFNRGGLEASCTFNEEDNGVLTANIDYFKVLAFVKCNFGPMEHNALEFQILDNNHQGTISGGNIRAFDYDAYDLNGLMDIRGGLNVNPNCKEV